VTEVASYPGEWAHDVTDGYTVPFVVLAGLNLVAAIIITFARPVPALAAASRPTSDDGAGAIATGVTT